MVERKNHLENQEEKKKKKISIHRGMIFGNEITIRNESIEKRRRKKMPSLLL